MQYNTELSDSALLLKIVGIPNVFEPDLSKLESSNYSFFLKLAKKNKIDFFFLKTIASKIEDKFIDERLLYFEEKFKKTIELTKFVASTLNNTDVSYTFFKTMKPYPYVPSDVDVLLLNSDDLKKVIKIFVNKGCTVLDGDSYGVTMYSPEHELNLDLTIQIAVSGLVYVNKQLLADHVKKVDVDGTKVNTLSPPADLLVVVAHSVFKEQMFTLSDYYFLIMCVSHWIESESLAENFYLSSALKKLFAMTLDVTLNVFDSLTPFAKELSGLPLFTCVDSDNDSLKFPKKYSLDSIIIEFLKKFADPSMIASIPLAMQSFFHPEFYIKSLSHATRKQY